MENRDVEIRSGILAVKKGFVEIEQVVADASADVCHQVGHKDVTVAAGQGDGGDPKIKPVKVVLEP